MGGDITGFNDDYGTIRFYSSGTNTFTIEILEDTVLNQLNYHKISLGYQDEFFLFTDDYIYRRVIIDDIITNIPFLSKILLNDHYFKKDLITDQYSFSFDMYIDSIITIRKDSLVYEDVYAVRTFTEIKTELCDTSFTGQYFLSNNYGIIAVKTENEFFILDSIIQ